MSRQKEGTPVAEHDLTVVALGRNSEKSAKVDAVLRKSVDAVVRKSCDVVVRKSFDAFLRQSGDVVVKKSVDAVVRKSVVVERKSV